MSRQYDEMRDKGVNFLVNKSLVSQIKVIQFIEPTGFNLQATVHTFEVEIATILQAEYVLDRQLLNVSEEAAYEKECLKIVISLRFQPNLSNGFVVSTLAWKRQTIKTIYRNHCSRKCTNLFSSFYCRATTKDFNTFKYMRICLN